jgi:transporter family protein
MSWLTWSLLSALFAAATVILAKVGVRQMDSNLATAIRATVVWLFTWALVLTLGRHPDGSELPSVEFHPATGFF